MAHRGVGRAGDAVVVYLVLPAELELEEGVLLVERAHLRNTLTFHMVVRISFGDEM